MDSRSIESIKIEKTIFKFLETIQNKIKKFHPKISKKINFEKVKINFEKVKIFNPSQSPSCKYLKNAINKIPNNLSPIGKLTKIIAYSLIWHEAQRGVPDFFKGGYAFAEIIGKMGLIFSDKIRIGLFLQKPNIIYPLHAHDADELYFILSGSADWQIAKNKFKVHPGIIINHESCNEHEMITSASPLLALWIWTGEINGRYWFPSKS